MFSRLCLWFANKFGTKAKPLCVCVCVCVCILVCSSESEPTVVKISDEMVKSAPRKAVNMSADLCAQPVKSSGR